MVYDVWRCRWVGLASQFDHLGEGNAYKVGMDVWWGGKQWLKEGDNGLVREGDNLVLAHLGFSVREER